nr:18-kda chloroplast DNA-binding iron-sulfur protein {N-terminal} [Chlamydomonas reinhardtii, Peptide Chloroplast Partial, 14 aa] [Chlamydomonas reinhardtii]
MFPAHTEFKNYGQQ